MRTPPLAPRRQRGVSLIVAMVMLVAIGFLSAAIMRSALTGDTVANNLRVQNFAMQQAQLGLRYCEFMLSANLATRTAAGVTLPTAPPADEASFLWKKFASWHGGAKVANDVGDAWIAGTDSSITVATKPQCLIERTITPPVSTYVITARGFSPDYAEDTAGHTTAGSVVWLQSVVALP